MKQNLFTSECVGKGHPDKICDQIADTILDACLQQDKNSRVACEVLATNRLIVIGGEITTRGYVDVVKKAWEVVKPLGYDESDFTIINNIHSQSLDISHLVDKKDHTLGAGDQGIVYGYATNKTSNYMPLSHVLATEIVKRATKLIDQKKFKGAKYDMKSQVTIDWTNPKRPIIDNMIASIQHDANVKLPVLRQYVIKNIFIPIAKEYKLNTNFTCRVNHFGPFITGGPIGDTGLTGRKIIVDNYGPSAHVGGGAFSGKDYTKVDRTGAYFARWIAKNIVAAKIADRCEIEISYCIGEPKPVAFTIECFGTNKYDMDSIYQTVCRTFDFDLASVVEQLHLMSPIYRQLSVFGHFGREDLNVEWEKLNKVNELLANLSRNNKKDNK